MLKLTQKEENRAREFKSLHCGCCYDPYPTLWRKILRMPKEIEHSGHFTYIIGLESGIGQSTAIKCNYCGKSEDITDYDTW